MMDQDDFKVEAYGTVSPPPGKEFCPECDATGGPDCPTCHGTWVVPKEDV
jgi:hypothetical protein